MRWFLPTLLLFLLFTPLVLASPYETRHLNILAVNDGGVNGSVADLYLELRDGSGRVFLDTQPLTKIDTQVSTRYARDIACDYYDLDCTRYDFIYTIRASSSIIGGPSAGAAISALTAVAVMDVDHNENVAVTGTINSGGTIGPVGGVAAKIVAASEVVDTVLVSYGSLQLPHNESNITIAQMINGTPVRVEEVQELDDILYYLTGESKLLERNIVTEDTSYTEIMSGLQDLLCTRANDWRDRVTLMNLSLNQTIDLNESWTKIQSVDDWYSAASFCFAYNVMAHSFYNEYADNTTLDQEENLVRTNAERVLGMLENEPVDTITDLQTKMVTKQRVDDALHALDNVNRAHAVAFASERLYTALSWMRFFQMDGVTIDTSLLSSVCFTKIAEAEERYNYATLYLPETLLVGTRNKIDDASQIVHSDPERCLITAIEAKAESSSVLSSLGVTEEGITGYIDSKLVAVERVISEQSGEGMFPILGYSYYRLAKTVREDNPNTALLYVEYALELSNLDVYFGSTESRWWQDLRYTQDLAVFLRGLFNGLAIGIFGMWLWKRRNYS